MVEEIKNGDKIVSYDFEKDSLRVSVVKEVVRKKSNKFHSLNGLLKITSDHIIYDFNKTKWVKVSELDINSRLIKYEGSNKISQFKNLIPVTGVFESYDLVLEGEYNNYFANGILVHNKSPEFKICHTISEPGFCDAIHNRPCSEFEVEGRCPENYLPFCDQQDYEGGAFIDTSLVTPTKEDTAKYCNLIQE